MQSLIVKIPSNTQGNPEGQHQRGKAKADRSKGFTSTRIRLLELELSRMRHDEHALLKGVCVCV